MKMELDRANAVVTGLCAGFARWADVDPLLTRISASLITFFFAPVAIPAYFITAVALKSGRSPVRSATRSTLGPKPHL